MPELCGQDFIALTQNACDAMTRKFNEHAPSASALEQVGEAPLTNRDGETKAGVAARLLRKQANTVPRTLDSVVALSQTTLDLPKLADQPADTCRALLRVARIVCRTPSGVRVERGRAYEAFVVNVQTHVHDAQVAAAAAVADDALRKYCQDVGVPDWDANTSLTVPNIARALDHILPRQASRRNMTKEPLLELLRQHATGHEAYLESIRRNEIVDR
jgi:ADP-ribosylglycohydrolase